MRLFKKISSMVLALAMAITLMAVPNATVSAADRGSIPSKIRIYPGNYDNYAIEFSYKNAGDQIKNLKTNNKNLIARQTAHREESEAYSSDPDNYASIGLYAKKEGKYTVSFDIYSKNGKVKRSSHKVTVYAKSDSPVNYVKLDGKYTWDYSMMTQKSAKLSVKMAKGYTLKSIQIRTYDKNGKEVVKKVKNNQKITLGQYGYSYSYSYQSSYNPESYYSYWSKNMNAQTLIEITYKDKYTKQLDTTTYSVSRLSN